MRTALLIAIPRKGPFEILCGPEVAIEKQLAEFKRRAAQRENAKLAELQLWVSDAGITKRLKFRDPKVEKKSEAEADAAARAEAGRIAAAEKAKADQLKSEALADAAKEKAQLEEHAKVFTQNAAADAPVAPANAPAQKAPTSPAAALKKAAAGKTKSPATK